jgi:hypothetical protein
MTENCPQYLQEAPHKVPDNLIFPYRNDDTDILVYFVGLLFRKLKGKNPSCASASLRLPT